MSRALPQLQDRLAAAQTQLHELTRQKLEQYGGDSVSRKAADAAQVERACTAAAQAAHELVGLGQRQFAAGMAQMQQAPRVQGSVIRRADETLAAVESVRVCCVLVPILFATSGQLFSDCQYLADLALLRTLHGAIHSEAQRLARCAFALFMFSGRVLCKFSLQEGLAWLGLA